MRGRRHDEQATPTTGQGEAPDEGRRGLVMVSDTDLLDAVLRTAAAAGCEVVRALDPTEARRSWPGAPVVVLDPPAARACADRGLPRRPGVVVAVSGEPPPEAWKHAVAVGAEHVISLPEAEPWLVAALAQAAEGEGGDGAVLAVVGGRGGAGASVFAVATAVRAARSGEPCAARRLRSTGRRRGPRPRCRGPGRSALAGGRHGRRPGAGERPARGAARHRSWTARVGWPSCRATGPRTDPPRPRCRRSSTPAAGRATR